MIAEKLQMPVAIMKNTLSHIEYLGWVEYLSNRRPPDVQEMQMAILMTMVSSFAGSKSKVDDFILSAKSTKKEPEKTPFDVFNAFASDMV